MDLDHFRPPVMVYIGNVSKLASMEDRSVPFYFVSALGQWMSLIGIFPLACYSWMALWQRKAKALEIVLYAFVGVNELC